MENRLDSGVRSVERERWRGRGRLPAGADKLICDTMAVWHGEEHTPPRLLRALTRFVWAGSVWQMQRRGQCPRATKGSLFGVLA